MVPAGTPRTADLAFEVESLQGRHIRADLARAVVDAGWNLHELRAVGLSLEEIFLQLTAAEKTASTAEAGRLQKETQMKNIWIICRKELKSYFASPIAYLLMAFFALIFGFFFFTATRDFVRFGFMVADDGPRHAA